MVLALIQEWRCIGNGKGNGGYLSPRPPELVLQVDAVRNSLWHLGEAAEGKSRDYGKKERGTKS